MIWSADGSKIEELTLHNTAARKAFSNLPYLKKVICSATVTRVEDTILENCPKFQLLIFEGDTPPAFATANLHLGTTPSTFKIYVPDNAVNTYKSVANLSQYKNNIFGLSQLPS